MSSSIFLIVLTSAVGMGYFVYGKKQEEPVPMLAGLALCLFPYFIDSPLLLGLVSLVLAALPFLLRG